MFRTRISGARIEDSLKALVVVCLIWVLAGSVSRAEEKHVRTITVHSSWGGLGKPGRSDLVIQQVGNGYVADGRTIHNDSIDTLVRALEEPGLISPNAANLGITAQWLRDHTDEAGRNATYFDYQAAFTDQKDLFQSAFTNEQTLQKRLDSLYAGFHTDDYPQMRVELVFDGGQTILLQSNSQHPFMIPWNVTQDKGTTKTYNANISRALLALLPEHFTNREALTDGNQYATGLLQELASGTGMEVEQRWRDLGAQHKAGDALSIIRRTYQIRQADVQLVSRPGFWKRMDRWKSTRRKPTSRPLAAWPAEERCGRCCLIAS